MKRTTIFRFFQDLEELFEVEENNIKILAEKKRQENIKFRRNSNFFSKINLNF
jgi:hypothetical protein